MQRIGVFLSANADVPEAFAAAAREVGAWIGRTGRTLVYGGSDRGLMGVLSEAAHAGGAQIVGIAPDILYRRGWVSPLLDVEMPTADLADRKALLVAQSDVLVALPGGVGTLDEVFTALATGSIGYGSKPVVLYNVDGCWDALLSLLDSLHARRLLRAAPPDIVGVARNIEELEALLGKA